MAFEFINGKVERYSSTSLKRKKKVIYYYVFYFASVIFSVIFTGVVFSNCMPEEVSLLETITLGSIFATFGSAIVSIFSLELSKKYDRFCNNIKILFSELINEKKWDRWPFIKREDHKMLFDREMTYQKLENAKLRFNVGSHKLEIDIATVREDFYDLPNWTFYFNMKKEARNYESFVLNNIKDPAISLMVWDCIYDNIKCILLYKIYKLMIIVGASFIISSICYAFGYENIMVIVRRIIDEYYTLFCKS